MLLLQISARDNQKLSKLLSRGLKDQYQKEYKTKSDNKNSTNESTYLLESNFVGGNSLNVYTK